MKAYKETVKIKIDGKINSSNSKIFLMEPGEAKNHIIKGDTFEEFWDLIQNNSTLTYYIHANLWTNTIFSKVRRIEFTDKIKKWKDDGTKREWEIEVNLKEVVLTLKDLEKFPLDKVSKYIKDNNFFL